MLWALLAFALGAATEVGYVGFVRASVAGRPLPAALWCALLVALGWAAIYLMVRLTWFIALPALVGHALGTYFAVRAASRRGSQEGVA